MMLSATTSDTMPRPSATASAMATMNAGNEKKMSVKRITSWSAQPPA